MIFDESTMRVMDMLVSQHNLNLATRADYLPRSIESLRAMSKLVDDDDTVIADVVGKAEGFAVISKDGESFCLPVNLAQAASREVAELMASYMPIGHWKSLDKQLTKISGDDVVNMLVELVDIRHFLLCNDLVCAYIDSNGGSLIDIRDNPTPWPVDFDNIHVACQDAARDHANEISALATSWANRSLNHTLLSARKIALDSGNAAKDVDAVKSITALNSAVDALMVSCVNSAYDPVYSNWNAYYQVALGIGFTIQDLDTVYAAKSALNLFRQQNGYTEGTYRRQWHPKGCPQGIEDNEFMMEAIAPMLSFNGGGNSVDTVFNPEDLAARLSGMFAQAYTN